METRKSNLGRTKLKSSSKILFCEIQQYTYDNSLYERRL
ncbi:unnamed protein product [Paramecium sonneborni]|uniref:Uncharacterized protein n=1 Tax=Paramecium sonneborni TaxID=65129 RepID=A0A8S1QN57_9CILI|nr:unnamed protein product [Paramecium sonneborni]